jgi:hypothetical protein
MSMKTATIRAAAYASTLPNWAEADRKRYRVTSPRLNLIETFRSKANGMDDAAYKIKMAADLFGVAGNDIVRFRQAGQLHEERIRLDDLLRRLGGNTQLELFKPEI